MTLIKASILKLSLFLIAFVETSMTMEDGMLFAHLPTPGLRLNESNSVNQLVQCLISDGCTLKTCALMCVKRSGCSLFSYNAESEECITGGNVETTNVTFTPENGSWITYAALNQCPLSTGFKRYLTAGQDELCLMLSLQAMMTYTDADHFCQTLGSRLVRVPSMDVLDRLRQVMADEGGWGRWTWVGADRLHNVSGNYLWNDGGLLPGGVPLWDGGARQGSDVTMNCIQLRARGGGLYDADCDLTRFFTCQFY